MPECCPLRPLNLSFDFELLPRNGPLPPLSSVQVTPQAASTRSIDSHTATPRRPQHGAHLHLHDCVPSTHARVNMGATGTFAGHFQAATRGCNCRFRQLARAAPERSRARAIAELRRWPVARTYLFAASPCRYLPPITHRRRKVPAPVRHMNRHARYESWHSKYAPSTHIIISFVTPASASIMRTTVLAARLSPQVQKCPLPLESGMPLQDLSPSHCACTYCTHTVPIFLKTPLSRCHVVS